jgi:hypothetical protein
MVSRMHIAKTGGAVWLFPASSGAATLVGVIHLTQSSRTCTSRGHTLAAVFARGDLVTRLQTDRTPDRRGGVVPL